MTKNGGPDAKIPIRATSAVPIGKTLWSRRFVISIGGCIGMTVTAPSRPGSPKKVRNPLD
jgi:hypothetical protein